MSAGRGAGYIAAKNPCLLAQMKHNWEIAHLPIKDRDEHILRAMGKVKEQYEKMSKKSFDEQNCPEVTRSQGVLSCSSLEVEIAAGSKYLFLQTLVTLQPRVPHR